MDAIETFTRSGITCSLFYDDDASSPAEWDQLGTMYALSRDSEYVGFQARSETHGQAIEAMERRGVAGLVRYLRLMCGIYALPFDVLSHGTSTIREASEKDTYCSGYIAADAASITMTGVPLGKVYDGLRSELDEWRQFFEGDVYGYVVTDAEGNTLDSCWGFYGFEYAKGEAVEMLNYHALEAEEDASAANTEVPVDMVRN